MRTFLLSALLVAGACLAADEGTEAPPPVDEQTARDYDRFREDFSRRIETVVERIQSRYEISDDRRDDLRRAVHDSAEQFLKDNGPKMFEVMQRLRSLRQLMRQEGMGWPDVPPDIRRDLAGLALPLVDAVQKQMTGFADNFAGMLDETQREKLAEDRRRMETGFQMMRMQVRLAAGEAPAGGPVEGAPGEGAVAPGAGRRATSGDPLASTLGRWERYLQSFIRRYRLDEVQKVQATDLLKEFKAKAERLPGAATQPAQRDASSVATTLPAEGQPASGTTTQPGSPGRFRQRLAELTEQRRAVSDLFEAFKVELEKIPAPVQRKLAEEESSGPEAPRQEGPVSRPTGETPAPTNDGR